MKDSKEIFENNEIIVTKQPRALIYTNEWSYFPVDGGLMLVKEIKANGSDMTQLESKLFEYALSLVDHESDHLRPICFTVGEFCDAYNIKKNGGNYDFIKAAVPKLPKFLLELVGENEGGKYAAIGLPFVASATIIDTLITITLEPRLKDALIENRTHNIRYPIYPSKSKYGLKLYKYLRSIGFPSGARFPLATFSQEIGIDDLRSKVYNIKKADSFIKDIFIPSVDDINQNCPYMTITHELTRDTGRGKKLLAVTFHVTQHDAVRPALAAEGPIPLLPIQPETSIDVGSEEDPVPV